MTSSRRLGGCTGCGLLRAGSTRWYGRYGPTVCTRAQSSLPIPQGSWDSHVHVIYDQKKYPLHPTHPYTPKIASFLALQSFHAKLHPHITHSVITSLSIYGNDNSCLLDVLRDLQKKDSGIRGVASIDPLTVSDAELQDMHEIGVRGVRLNLKSALVELSKAEFEKQLYQYADRLKPLKKWALQIHTDLPQLALIADVIPKLGITVIIDHLAHPSVKKPAKEQNGYKDFLRLLARGEIYTKLSGMDRFPTLPLLDEYATEVVSVAPDRVVWASDWPHTGGATRNPDGDRKKVQDFRDVDDLAALTKAVEVYCKGDEDVVKKIWKDNAIELWDYSDT
ncbi:hypothetical protein H072_641 [Dactylellina haptotyla CBS 200.50]|uniref:Amidohydrolase-related domain-containing protein n=1 Tax=Dactylellina haptotyla (strain CBS 200.50) TaxID=1284197 RepID=S8C0X9_DACHA|nr:hypothetical protein H072_641 [Dactylellina haptotyla CBS 200.50]